MDFLFELPRLTNSPANLIRHHSGDNNGSHPTTHNPQSPSLVINTHVATQTANLDHSHQGSTHRALTHLPDASETSMTLQRVRASMFATGSMRMTSPHIPLFSKRASKPPFTVSPSLEDNPSLVILNTTESRFHKHRVSIGISVPEAQNGREPIVTQNITKPIVWRVYTRRGKKAT